MKIIDCFLYNGELEILKIRLKLMNAYIDKFLIIEAEKTFSGIHKKDLLRDNVDSISAYLPKIEYHLITNFPITDNLWEIEYFLRDQIRVFSNAQDDDLLIISDVDEILNMDVIIKKIDAKLAQLIELPCYYNFLNLQSTEKIYMTLIAPYKIIKYYNIGNRHNYKLIANHTIYNEENYPNGGHFTYQFGGDLDKYRLKIGSFSHSEYNTSFFLNTQRLNNCLKYNIDILERWEFKYHIVDLKRKFPLLFNLVNNDPDYNDWFKKKTNFSFINKLFYLINYDPFRRYIIQKLRVILSKLKQKIYR